MGGFYRTTLNIRELIMDQLRLLITATHPSYLLILYVPYVVCCGRHKPLIGQLDTETMAGQTQQLLIVLSAMDVIWLVWHIVSADNMNGVGKISGDCHSHEQKLYS